MYAIIRWKAVADTTLGDGTTSTLLVGLGLLSLAIASFSLVLIRNYKRMLAYSSIEHTGLICIGLGLGPLGAFAALLHLVNHTIAKCLMFLLAGNVEWKYRSPFVKHVRGLLTAMPGTGGLFAFTLLMLMGLPPGGFFISEFTLFRAGFTMDHAWLMAGVLALLALAFVAFVHNLQRMLFGAPPEGMVRGEPSRGRLAPLYLGAALLVLFGLTLPRTLESLLNRILAVTAVP
jgi:hydrogenase-4 component F